MEQNGNRNPVRQQPSEDRRECLLGLLRLVAERVVLKLEDERVSGDCDVKTEN